jgi:hypothetical protein
MQQLLGSHVLAEHGVHASVLLGRGFFPGLISKPFANGLHMAFLVAAGMCFVGAIFSWLRGPNPARVAHPLREESEEGLAGVAEVVMVESGVGSAGAVTEPEFFDAQ